MRWATNSNYVSREDDFDSLLEMKSDEITDLLLDWIDSEKLKGNKGTLNISNPRKHAHTFSIPDFGVNTEILEPREGKQTATFVADKTGVFTFYCGLPYNADRGYCDPDHSMMTGTLIVLE